MSTEDYDPPPAPPGLPTGVAYLGEMQTWSTRMLLRDADRRHQELRAVLAAGEAQRVGWLARIWDHLPQRLQSPVAFGAVYLLLQLGGALVERVTGRPVPQPTAPITGTVTIDPNSPSLTGNVP